MTEHTDRLQSLLEKLRDKRRTEAAVENLQGVIDAQETVEMLKSAIADEDDAPPSPKK